MNLLGLIAVILSCGQCLSRKHQGNLENLEMMLKRETADIKREVLEIWTTIEALNSSERCTCSRQEFSTQKGETGVVKDPTGGMKVYAIASESRANAMIETEEKDKMKIILNLENMEIFQQHIDETLEKFEKTITDKIESARSSWNTELYRFVYKMRENFVDIENKTSKEVQMLKLRLADQEQTITDNKARIAKLERQLENIPDLLLQQTESHSPSTSTSPIPTRSCRDGWVLFNNTCYMFSMQKTDWFSAVDECRTLDGKLAEPTTSDQVEFLSRLTRGTRVWIGATDRFEEGSYVWESSREPLSYLPWEPGQPNNFLIDQDCVEMIDTDPLLNDKPCLAQDAFVCEQ